MNFDRHGNAPLYTLYRPRLLSELPVDYRLLERIRMREEANDFAQSRALYCEAIRQPDVPVEMFYYLGRALVIKRHYEQAHAALAEALVREPGYGQARSLLGLVCLNLRDYEEAYGHLMIAVRLDPRDLAAWTRLHLYYYQQNLREPMIELLKMAVKHFPDSPGFRDHLKELTKKS
ncbi:MAG TPA: tetratricopeptide repeat protein [Kiritimatiellia bacterium]|nr:tetratricopeptide repeat protein [Kiritimatiellia bacterium]